MVWRSVAFSQYHDISSVLPAMAVLYHKAGCAGIEGQNLWHQKEVVGIGPRYPSGLIGVPGPRLGSGCQEIVIRVSEDSSRMIQTIHKRLFS